MLTSCHKMIHEVQPCGESVGLSPSEPSCEQIGCLEHTNWMVGAENAWQAGLRAFADVGGMEQLGSMCCHC